MKSRLILSLDVLLLCLLTSCSLKQFYPTAGALVGGGVGALSGNPAIAGMGAGSGALLGEMAKGNAVQEELGKELEEATETIEALTTGDVEKLVELRMKDQESGWTAFMARIQKILIISAVCLGVYLMIPIFFARRAKEEARKAKECVTRPPFPVSPRPPTNAQPINPPRPPNTNEEPNIS